MTKRDYYEILDVSRKATDDEIKKSYRRLAMKFHPDRNANDKESEERIKEIKEAYEVLSDGRRRAAYDQYGHAGVHAGAQGFGDGAGMNFSDIFGDFFGRTSTGAGGFNMRGMDYRYHLEIEFLEAVNGIKKRVLLPEGETLDISVPSGVVQGQVLRLKGKGGPGVGRGVAGDALIELKIRPHSHFERDGDNILLDLPVALYEAVLGAKVEVPTIAGRVALTVPKGASSGQVMRLRGKGVRNSQTGNTGDQLVKLNVVLPERVDRELFDFMEEWAGKHPYNPRAKLREVI